MADELASEIEGLGINDSNDERATEDGIEDEQRFLLPRIDGRGGRAVDFAVGQRLEAVDR